jgi:hypothetical protein
LERSGTIGCLLLPLGLPVPIALGWLILTLFGTHGSGLVRWGTVLLVGIVAYGVVVYILTRVAADRLGVEDLGWKPVSITLKDGQYLLEFYNVKMAEIMRQINSMIETG